MIFVSSNSISLQTLNVHSYKMFAKGKQTSTSVCSLYLKSFQVHSAQFLLLKKCAKKFGSNSRSSREEFLIKREASVEKKSLKIEILEKTPLSKGKSQQKFYLTIGNTFMAPLNLNLKLPSIGLFHSVEIQEFICHSDFT